jgi:hypothetical protein
LLVGLQGGTRRVSAGHASENQRDHVRWHAGVEGVAQHALLNSSLLEPQAFLAGALLFLSSAILFRLGLQPLSHGVLGIVPLRRRRGQWAHRGHGG